MATEKREIEIALRSRGAEAGADRLNTKVKSVGKSADTAESSLFKMSKVAAALGVALAGAGVATFFTQATSAALKFNESISNLSAITGAVGDDLKFLRNTALEFGATTTLSATEAAEALKLVASAKPDLLSNAAALKEVTRQAVLLAEASGGTLALADAAAAVGKALNQFGEEADQAGRFVNVLAAGAKFGSSEVLATSQALKEAGVAAASANVSFEETNAAIQVLAKNGIDGSQAGTALRNIFLKLDNDTNTKLRPSVVGLSQALANVNKLNEDGAAQVKRFGLENIVAAKSLLSNVDAIGDLTGKLTGTNTALEQASTNVDNLSGDVKALGSAYESLQIRVGSLADGELRQLTQATTEFIQALNGNQDALDNWSSTLTGIETIAVAVASVVAGRFVSSIYASATALTVQAAAALKATTQTNYLGQVVGRTTLAMNASALAARGFGSALALVGGPVGVAVTAAAAIAYYVTQSDLAAPSTEKYSDKVGKLTKNLNEAEEAQGKVNVRFRESLKIGIERQLDELNKKLAKQEQLAIQAASSGRDIGSGFTVAQAQAQKLREEIAKLKQSLFELQSGVSKEKILEGVFTSPQTGGEAGLGEFGVSGGGTGGKDKTGGGTGGTPPEQSKEFLSLKKRLELETLAIQEEAEVKRAFVNKEINQRQLDEELALQSIFYNYEARRMAILENEQITAEQKAQLLEELSAQELAAEEAKQAELTAAARQGAEDRVNTTKWSTEATLGALSTGFNALANLESKNFDRQKKLRKASVVIDTASAIMKTWDANGGYPYAIPPALAMAAAGAAQLAQINKTNPGGGASLSTPSAGGASATTPSAINTPSVENQSQQKVIRFEGLENFGPDDMIPITKSQFESYISQSESANIAINQGQQNAQRVGAI